MKTMFDKGWLVSSAVALLASTAITILFRDGAQGAWYDPSDHDTLAIGHLGQTPVNTVLSPDLTLDRSTWGGQTFDQVVAAQTNLAAAGGWSSTGTSAENAGTITFTAGSSTSEKGVGTVGKYYWVTFTVAVTSGQLIVRCGSTTVATITASGTYSYLGVFTAGNPLTRFLSSGGAFVGSVSAISTKEIPGNHYYAPAPAGQAIGLMYDKRLWGGKTRAQVLAAATPVLSDDFASYANTAAMLAVWFSQPVGGGGDPTLDTGRLAVVTTSGGVYQRVSRAITTVAGMWYVVTMDVAGVNGGFSVGSTVAGTQNLNVSATVGARTFLFMATASTTYVTLGSVGTVGTTYFDNVVIKALPGNHVQQATQASKPFLARLPYGEPQRNWLIHTEALSNAAWNKGASGGLTATAGAAASPIDGMMTASLLVPAAVSGYHSARQGGTTTAVVHTHSYYVKAAGYSRIAIREDYAVGHYAAFLLSGAGSVIEKTGAATASIEALPAPWVGWYRINLTPSTASATMGTGLYVLDNSYTTGNPAAYTYTGDGASGVLAVAAQFERGSVATAYQRIGSAYSLRKNLLTYSDQFDNAYWTKNGNLTVAPNQTMAPDTGTLSVDLLTDPNTGGYGCITAAALPRSTDAYTASFNVMKDNIGRATRYPLFRIAFTGGVGKSLDLLFDTSTGDLASASVGTVVALCQDKGTYWRVILAGYDTGANTSVNVQIYPAAGASSSWVNSAAAVGSIYAWGVDLREGIDLGERQAVVSQYDVSEAGQRDLWFLLVDGTNDFMSVPTDLSAGDKVSMVAGLYKATDTSQCVMELTSTFNNPNSFFLFSGDGPNKWSSGSRGNAAAAAGHMASDATPAPDLAVISATHDIAGDLSRLWRNGVKGADGTLDKGAGNFANSTLFMFGRNGTGNFFNGRFFGGVLYAGILNDNQRGQIERIMNVKSGRLAA